MLSPGFALKWIRNAGVGVRYGYWISGLSMTSALNPPLLMEEPFQQSGACFVSLLNLKLPPGMG